MNCRRIDFLYESSTMVLYTKLYNIICSSSVFPSEVARKIPLKNTPKNQDPAFDSARTFASMRWISSCSAYEERSTLGSW